MTRVDIATVTDFHDSEASKAAGDPAGMDPHPRGKELVPIPPRRVGIAQDQVGSPPDTNVAAVRVRLGVLLPNGRIAGRVDQVVHVVPLPPPAAQPAPLQAYCGLPVESDKVDFVELISGQPCPRCLLFALHQDPPEK